MRAEIHWKTKQEGGRLKPPAGVGQPPYATVVRFKDSKEPWPPPIAWSLVVEKVSDMGDEHHWAAEVRFLVNEAPVEELRAGREFELFEGARCVANGVLTGAAKGESARAANGH
jgi:hypothetical protein